MKRLVAIMLICFTAFSIFAGCGAQNDGSAAVESVAMITGMGYVGAADSYAGMVVSGETAEIKKDADKTVLEVYVEEGDMVEEGDVLFAYDMEAMQLSLDKLYIEKESLENSISAAESEIAELQTQKSKASSSQQLSYTLQIDARQADKREAEYNLALKEREVAAMEADMENTEITAPMSGRVMSVGSTDDSNSYDYTGGDTSDAFITVMDVSAYRVEGHINELNRGTLYEGMEVLVRSRTDADQVWYGTIASIDWENPVKSSQSYYMDEMSSSSKYPFYVLLEKPEGLMLGQHVYIEPNLGEVPGSGLMLPSYYLNDAEGSPWVWAASDKGRLEKRPVTLGSYDPEWDEYEIVSGLDVSDYIAFPMEGLSEGMSVEYYDESSFGGGAYYEDDFYYEEGYYYDDGTDGSDEIYDDGEYFEEDGAYDEGEFYFEEAPAAAVVPG